MKAEDTKIKLPENWSQWELSVKDLAKTRKYLEEYWKDYQSIFELEKKTNYKDYPINDWGMSQDRMIYEPKFFKNHLDPVWDELFRKLDPKYKEYLFFAGGCFQSIALKDSVNDYDLFCSNPEVNYSIQNEIKEKFKSSLISAEKSLYFYSGDHQINYVRNFMGKPNTTIASFDFTHCMSYYTGDGEMVLSLDLGRKELIFNKECKKSVGSLYRVKKFLSRGYTINTTTFNMILDKAKESLSNTFGNNTEINKEMLNNLTTFYQDNK